MESQLHLVLGAGLMAPLLIAGPSIAMVHPWSDALAVQGLSPERLAEEHDPIRIQGDHEAAAPDALSGNGVRSGTGTADDPWIIRDWVIEAGSGPAIAVENVQGWLRIENVKLIQQPENPDPAIHIALSPHLTVGSVTVSEGASVLGAYSSELTMTDVSTTEAPVRDTLPPFCIRAMSSTIDLRDVELEACGRFFTTVNRSSVTAHEIAASANQGFLVSGDDAELKLEESELLARDRQSNRWVPTLIKSAGDGSKTIDLERVRLEAKGGTCIAVQGPPGHSVTVTGRELVCAGADEGLILEGVAASVDGDIRVTESGVALHAHDSRVEAETLEVREGSTGVSLSGNSTLSLDLLDARHVDTLVRASSGSTAEIQTLVSDGGDVQGPVNVHETQEVAADGEMSSTPNLGFVGLASVLSLSLALASGGRP